MKQIQLHLIPSLIIERAKNETYLKGKIDKVTQQNAEPLAYNEQMGDDIFHERKAQAALIAGLENVKTVLSDYIEPHGFTVADNAISHSISEANDTLDIILYVADRFNDSYTESLAKITGEYISDFIVEDWFRVINPNQAAIYTQKLSRDIISIQRCFNKTPPKVPVIPYPTSIELSANTIDMVVGEEADVTYIINDGAIDDVVAADGKPRLRITRVPEYGFILKALSPGTQVVRIFSYHNNAAKATVTVKILKSEYND